jgi:GTP cyclohydrolase I
MDDVQSRPDTRGIPLDQVGIADLRYPIVVLDRAADKQHTIGRLTMSVNLPHGFKGTHMSRFIEVLNEHRGEVTVRTIPSILRDLKDRLSAESARIQVSFPYFVERAAPKSGARALMDYECQFIGEVNGGNEDFILTVTVPVTSLCPCSKEISDYGAHNQRGYIAISVRTEASGCGSRDMVWIEELLDIAERSSSAPVYALLKREDERALTMMAYDNPVFVEDMVRNVAEQLQRDVRISWFRVHAANQESIHNHSAFACSEWSRLGATAVRRTLPHQGEDRQIVST